MTTTVNIHEAKTHLSRLLEAVQSGETVIIAKAGQPIAQLSPMPVAKPFFGCLAGEKYAFLAELDFDTPDPEILAMWKPELGVEVPGRASA